MTVSSPLARLSMVLVGTLGLLACSRPPEAERVVTAGAALVREPPQEVSASRAGRARERADFGAKTYASMMLTPAFRSAQGAPGASQSPFEAYLGGPGLPIPNNGLCPPDMASVDDRFCVDQFEASLLEILPNGEERQWSAFEVPEGRLVRAVSVAGVYPQGYVSGKEASRACARSGKRLCKPLEWKKACMGPQSSTFGYGNEREPRRCNDHGKSSMGSIYGFAGNDDREYWSMDRMNNPALNQVPGTLAKTGDHAACTNDYGVVDMVGNLHEWVDDPAGTFQGGYYLDTAQNGDGCLYRTMAHETWYHDYSTGFRCCADVAP